ncbi:MAG: MFS transporter [Deltaproteobacteria bacterium]|nr:MFS transporter [Deltaproteobacteria bacterium]MBW1736168.1 MFS transporter [Deltaproteobacteria bacterium]MBW1907974.1 MFS transporter [Deltaproteobacteria bacterium]MBW2034185.1 MFS transporter [Deltaproteobacteria bacterium]MBW2168166.1 MFS transporter [Deltaproteobacteria bacterium]
MNKREKKIMGLTIGSHSLVHLFEGVLPPLIPLLITEFSTDYFHMGLVVTVFSYAFGLGSLPAGILADKFGPRRLVSIYLFGAGLSAILVWPVNTLWSYGIIMGVIGMCCSTYHPASNTLISLSMANKGHAFGIHGIAGSLGVAGVPVLSAFIGSIFGWRAPHVLYGLIGIFLGVYSLSVAEHRAPSIGGSDGQSNTAGLDRKTFLTIIIFFLSATALGMSYKGIMTFLPIYMGTRVNLGVMNLNTVTLGGTIATLALTSGAVGQYLAGRLVDRHSAERLYLGAVVIGMICVFVMSFSTNVLLVVSAVIYAFFYFSTQPIQNYLISRYLPEHRHGLGYGIHFFLSFGVGSTAAAISGYIADQVGLEAVFIFMGLCFFMSACMVVLLVLRKKGVTPISLPT